MAKALTAVAVAKARAGAERREIPDGGCRGLYLVVQPSGVKSWAARYRYRGRSSKYTLGPVLIDTPESAEPLQHDVAPLSLASARELCARVLREAQAGRDPAAERRSRREQQRAAEADTLQAVGEEFLRREGPRLRTLSQRKADLELLYPSLGRLPIDQIKRGQYKRVFDAIADERSLKRAARVQRATKALLNWHGGRSDYVSVLTGTKALISISEHARSHVPSDADLKAIVLAAERDKLFGSYLLFTLLTATRRGEGAGLRRSELSPDGRVWTIPAARYKSKRDTVVPLSVAAQKILATMPVRPGGDYVFSADGASELGNWDARKARFDAACGIRGWVIHDLRRAARTLLSRAGVSSDIAERCLGHAMVGVRGTYDRYAYESEKRHAFEALARMVEEIVRPPAATVVPIRRANARRRK